MLIRPKIDSYKPALERIAEAAEALEALDKLGDNQYVLWKPLSRELVAAIKTADTPEKIDAVIERYLENDDRGSIELCKTYFEGDLLFQETVTAFNAGLYNVAIVGFMAIFDRVMSECSGMLNDVNFRRRMEELEKRIDAKGDIYIDDLETKDYLLFITYFEATKGMLSMPKEFEDRLHLYYEVYSVVKDIGFDLTIPISDYTDQQLVQIDKLMGIKSGKYNERLSEGINKYQWKFGDKYVPLLLVKNGDSIDIVSSIYTDKYAIYLPDGIENKGYRMPLFAYADVEVLGNLCCYDYPAFEKQIENSEFNERSAGALLECALKMISVYDICSDDHFLDLAILILNRLNSYESEIIIELNKLQIKRRKGGLEASDISFLNGLPVDDLYLQFGKYVLLGQKEQAMDCFK